MRFFECAASRPSLRWPVGSRSKCAPAVCSSRTRAGPSSTSTCTAAASQSAAPAARVSRRCSAGESPAPSAAAMPPCAYAVALSNSERFVNSSTSPCSDARHAVCRPATPLPTTRKRDLIRSDMRGNLSARPGEYGKSRSYAPLRFARSRIRMTAIRLALSAATHDCFAMRKLLILVAVLLAVHVGFLFVRVSGAAQTASPTAVEVGLVLDVGGLGDKSFNDGANRRAERAEKELGAHVRL